MSRGKTADVAYLETLATAIINGGPIKGIAFCLVTEGKEPYVSFYEDAGPEMVIAMMHELDRTKKLRQQLAEEHGETTSVEEASFAANDMQLLCEDSACTLLLGHEGFHESADGHHWHEGQA